MDSALQSPLPSREDLKKLLVGKKLSELPTPIALVDRHVAAINCKKMLDACSRLNVLFRSHIKTHKVLICDFCYQS